MRSVTNGVISERDRLMDYTIGSFYNEMSLFIEEQEKKEAYYKSLNKKK